MAPAEIKPGAPSILAVGYREVPRRAKVVNGITLSSSFHNMGVQTPDTVQMASENIEP